MGRLKQVCLVLGPRKLGLDSALNGGGQMCLVGLADTNLA